MSPPQPAPATAVRESFARRDAAVRELGEQSERLAATCQAMALRFRRSGKLIVFGNGAAGADAGHVAVEFMHPVIVGKRALPAISLSNDAATVTGVSACAGFDGVFAHQVRCFAEPDDIALGISADGRCANVRRGLEAAAELGLLTVSLGGAGKAPPADYALVVMAIDPAVVKEAHVTAYHLLWELVHVFLERSGTGARR